MSSGREACRLPSCPRTSLDALDLAQRLEVEEDDAFSVRFDGKAFSFEDRPYVIMKDQAYVSLGKTR